MPKPSSGRQQFFTFNNKGEKISKNESHDILPAYANVRIKNKTLEGAMEEFRKQHANSDHEWAYVVDNQGFVHKYVEGDDNSVKVSSDNPEHMILHNHPKGGIFSRYDMINFATSLVKGIVATTPNGYDYIIEKGTHFNKKSSNFINDILNAKIKGKNYDDAIHKWLTDNQKKYSYKYSKKESKV